ncbi:MAG TPA: hydrolase [Deferribacteraceae bacterium]|jgi:predicted amidohydrolase|nr:hydrolase [Deferribacteraceae bacterium]
MRVCLAQIKPFLGDTAKNLELHEECIEQAVAEKCDVIVFPELSLTGYYLMDYVNDVAMKTDDKAVKRIISLSKDISVVFGFVYEGEDNLFYNVCAYAEKGRLVHLHKKVYLPDYTMFEEARYFAAGNGFSVFDTAFGKCGMLICEDALHLSSIYVLSRMGVQTVFIPSNSPARGVVGDGLEAASIWQTSNKYTASLLTVNLVYVNRAGVEDGVAFWGGSEAYSALGKRKIQLPQFEAAIGITELETADIRLARIHSPFYRDEKSQILLDYLKGDKK